MSEAAANAPEPGPATNGDDAMTDNLTGAGHNRLGVLAAEIVEHHGAARAATREAIQHAIEAGRRLAEAKKLVGHGGWLPWLKANVPGISARTAQRYLAAAEHAGKNDTVSFFRLRDLARRPRPRPLDRVQALLERYQSMIEAVLADMEAPDAYSKFRAAQEMGLQAGDLLARLIAKSDREMIKLTVAFGEELAEAQVAMPAAEWAPWLQAEHRLTPKVAALVIDAAAARKTGRPFDMKAISDAMLAMERPAA
jgi:Protein of unknown function (DUF3102)